MAKETASAGDSREKNLKAALGQIEKEFGKGSIMRLGERPRQQVDVISSGA
ncbi:MAG: DNA recombination/repair protein RecA, partial [Victivallales bacterium]|nr:DNA recombination/repair protein RecA [Victivallales bacterium]